MRRAVLVLLLLAAGVAVVWLAGSRLVSASEEDASAEVWPAGLAALTSVPQRYPRTTDSEAARALKTLDVPDALRKELGEYVRAEVGRPSIVAAAPPAAVASYLAAHAAQLDALEQVLTSQPIVWESDLVNRPARSPAAPLPDLRQIVQVERVLVARALSRPRDAAAGRSLHAVWNVGHALLQRQELVAALVGVSFARTVNAASRFLAPPAPAWRAEMLTMDYSRAAIAALQADLWSATAAIRDFSFIDDDTNAAAKPFLRGADLLLIPYRRQAAAELLRAERKTAATLYAQPNCIVAPQAFDREVRSRLGRANVFARIVYSDLGTVWRRIGRFRIELEATNKLLARDFGPRSACPDGRWLFDGTTLRFSQEFASAPQAMEMPLHFAVR